MRWFLVVRLHAFQFQRLHRGGLAQDFFLKPLQQFALFDDNAVQLLHLMFEVREVRLKLVGAPGIFVCHETNLPAPSPEVEPVMAPAGRAKAAKVAK